MVKMVDKFCKLTLEDCKNIIESLDLANQAVVIAHIHGMNPFDSIPEEKNKELSNPFDKIRAFIKQNET